jgi:arylsulfatase A-like enzyme
MFVHSQLLSVKNAKSDALVSSLDVFLTILDYAGVTAPSQLMGKSLRPIMNAPDTTVRDCVFTECVGPPESRLGTGHCMACTDHFKYMLSADDEEVFFDLRTDPYEMKNLIADASRSAEIERHRALPRGWLSSVGEKRLTMNEAKKRPNSKKKAKSKKAAK